MEDLIKFNFKLINTKLELHTSTSNISKSKIERELKFHHAFLSKITKETLKVSTININLVRKLCVYLRIPLDKIFIIQGEKYDG